MEVTKSIVLVIDEDTWWDFKTRVATECKSIGEVTKELIEEYLDEGE